MHKPLTQEHADPDKPEEALAWAFWGLPHPSGGHSLSNPVMAKYWSKHFTELGIVHVDSLRRLADESGNIHVSKLPQQTKKFQAPARGPRSHYNPAAQWVPSDTPEPPKFRVQDPRTLTQQEQQAQLDIYKQMGLIPTAPLPQHQAAVE
ncbi:hypothetical protein PBI_RUFUS_29 [Mycobacterium phage Rufus]|uniref:Minor tail protein n=1 Tax=Mycobacterium phage Bruns TaxID=2902905 RepID=G8I5X5_9CAUD|nr:minor tail protein [Mycobacterium phage Bruns]YP_009199543.1 minor tail protein [Mycobacterium phage Rufus]AXH47489.1 hypothetical protein SEA_HOPE4EVER_28 [Mycobacterium phage Hope4ever]QBI96999.1 minor tail protein [Mycobacterium phage Francis47]QRI44850.1 minor tail protein [Mycobacterium phage Rubeus]AER48119.1 hypothetical protein BRUNS_27 [Mycobacterium phage Bruns]ALA46393.1 hypothetical protein PBI_RUFUS_29 [Mycobacterium phage Rufus]